VVNGKPVFLQGANWVPPKAIYHDTTRADYENLIRLYQDMGANVLRVWGGGILETHDFYDLCDHAGILVWQELPLSSSGVENCPPDTPEAIAQLTRIARSYVQRRAHHASLLLWSGGNELTWGGPNEKTGILPVDEQHPCIAALRDTLTTCDPAHRFVATSPTGPRFCADAKEYGQGLHHDIHGPWGLGGFEGDTFEERLEKWRAYWKDDDSLFRSETGMPGAASAECIERYADADLVWPPQGRYWMHTAAWWTQWDLCRKDMEPIADKHAGIDAYIEQTQAQQAQAYGFAAKVCKARFPKCGGFIIWMGHDCFPCLANNSVIDFLCTPKPAYFALQEIFKSNTD
jgi:beta-mannosidase